MSYFFRFDYLGLEAEAKPVATSVADGSTFYEVDTGKLYLAYKGTWYLQDFSETPDNSEEVGE